MSNSQFSQPTHSNKLFKKTTQAILVACFFPMLALASSDSHSSSSKSSHDEPASSKPTYSRAKEIPKEKDAWSAFSEIQAGNKRFSDGKPSH